MSGEHFPETALDGASAHIQELVKQHVDDVYGAILNGVQDYLIDNAQFNIGQKIATAERGERDALAKVAALEVEKTELLKAARQVEDWWLSDGMNVFVGAPACIFNLRAAIAKAGDQS